MLVDARAHACGEYQSPDSIRRKLDRSGCGRVILTPGQYGSRITYPLKNRALKAPFADVVSGGNRRNKALMKLVGAIRDVPRGNEYVCRLVSAMPGRVYQSYWVTKANVGRLDADYARMGFVSVKLHQCWEDFSIEETYFGGVASWAEVHGIPLFIHVYSRDEMRKLIRYIIIIRL